MKVSEIMTVDPVCCARYETAEVGAMLMQELNVGVIPVVEDEKSYRLVGMVTDRDLCIAIVAHGKDPKMVTLDECMSHVIVSCTPDQDVEEAMALMENNHIRRLPVVDEERRIQGIVSTTDIALYSSVPPEDFEKAMQQIAKRDAESIHRELGASYFSPTAN